MVSFQFIIIIKNFAKENDFWNAERTPTEEPTSKNQDIQFM